LLGIRNSNGKSMESDLDQGVLDLWFYMLNDTRHVRRGAKRRMLCHYRKW